MPKKLALLWTLTVLALPVCAQNPQPCKATVTGQLETIPLTSQVFHNTRNLYVWLPPGYSDPANAQKKYPVLYILDGASAFDACTAFHHDELHADETLTDLMTSGKIPPLIAVGIDNASDILGRSADAGNRDDGQARAREYLPYPDPLSGIRQVIGDHFPDFLAGEVIPAIAGKYRVLTGAQHATLWGASYAGAAALYITIRRPDLFDSVIMESPSLQIGNGQLFRDSVSLITAPKRIALGIGDEEIPVANPDAIRINATWVRLMKQLAENLRAAAYATPDVHLTVAQGAHHSTGDFGKRLAEALLFIYQKQTDQ